MADRKPRFEVYPDKGGSYRWRLLAANGVQVASSGEGFESKANARRAVDAVRRAVADADAEITEIEAG